jgi:hypothetical protein
MDVKIETIFCFNTFLAHPSKILPHPSNIFSRHHNKNYFYHMKNIITLLLTLFATKIIFAQDSNKILTAKSVNKKIDNYTIQRIIVFNAKKEILMQRNRFGCFTPSIRSNENQSLKEGLDSLAKAIGIVIEPIKLAGIFTYKYDGLPDHIGLVSYRTHYKTKYISGELIQYKDPKDSTRLYKWMPIKEALEAIGMQALKEETTQIILYPKKIWGGSFLLSYKNDVLQSIKKLEEFYSLN